MRRLLMPLISLLAVPAFAEPLPRDKVPTPLKPWVDWVLQDHPDAFCPSLPGGEGDEESGHLCAWPSRLTLALDARGGKFTQGWQTFAPAVIALPGDAKHWPQDVKIDGKPAAVVPRGETPSIHVAAGAHTIAGTFAWQQTPESLKVPEATALLSLSMKGKQVAHPSRDASGALWLQREDEPADVEESRLELTVYRLLADETPLMLTTRIRFDVSGKSREVVVARPLLPDFQAFSIGGDLPARLEADGRLRVQVRPGTWTLDVVGRHIGPVEGLLLAKTQETWAPTEIWAFDARPELRVVEVEGVPTIDPSQTTMPDEWRQFPAYRMLGGDTMKLTERRRGDADPAPDRLSLRRTLWLDFDGGGYSVNDVISGRLTRSWRLDMQAPVQLGRVVVAGKDQLVTRRTATDPAGVELRQGALSLVADSRIDGKTRKLPAVGWNADFQSVSGTLHLPPGWRLLHAGGIDDVPGTWVKRWTLLDLFLVLVTAVVIGRLFGMAWGGIAVATLVLAYPEADAPKSIWLVALALEALARVVKPGWMTSTVRTLRTAVWIGIALVLVPFAVKHVRLGMYPTLEHPYGSIGDAGQSSDVTVDELAGKEEGLANVFGDTGIGMQGNAFGGGGEAIPNAPAAQMEFKAQRAPSKQRAKRLLSLEDIAASNSSGGYYQQRLDLNQSDPKAKVQTGPGRPEWGWQEMTLKWSGPVERVQQVTLWLVPPAANLMLALLRVALLAMLLWHLVRRADGPRIETPSAPLVATGAAILMLFAPHAASAGAPDGEESPNSEILDQLREKLTAPPTCAPECVGVSRMFVEATPTNLRLRLELGAAATSTALLPGGLDQWNPSTVTLDGKPATTLTRTADGTLAILVGSGAHQVVMDGPLPSRESVGLPLPLRPHRVTSKLTGWTLDGVDEDGIPDDALQLSREARGRREEKSRGLEPSTLPPFVRVERALLLGMDWTIQTRVTRLSPAGTPIVLEVPLLEGESVLSADVRSVGGKAQLNMAPRATEVSWTSTLSNREKVELVAPAQAAWTEVRRLEAGAVWHVEWTGIPPILGDDEAASRIPEWRPWPGEKLSFAVTRPAAVPGPTKTVQSAVLTVDPGLRATDASLEIRLAASVGGRVVVMLSGDAVVQSVLVDGRSIPVRREGEGVPVEIKPGLQTVRVVWREPRGMTTLFRSPRVKLVEAESGVALPLVNVRVNLNVPAERWLLSAGGMPVGPAVLYWSMLLIVLVIAVTLARFAPTPLRTLHWVLLALGLTQVPIGAAAVVAFWLVVLGLREQKGPAIPGTYRFDLVQLAIPVLTLVALGVLFEGIRAGLLGSPDMQVQGNGSTSAALHWFQDRVAAAFPEPWVFSVDRLVYRGVMLAWALWIAVSLVGWLRWGWKAFATGGLWRPIPMSPRPGRPPAPPPPAPPATP